MQSWLNPRYCFDAILIGLLEAFSRLPCPLVIRTGYLLLPLYTRLRWQHVRRIRKLLALYPHSALDLNAYYRTRLELMTYQLHWTQSPPQATGIRIFGEENYIRALETERPLVLAGLHLGAFELLHRIPFSIPAANGRLKIVLVGPSFSPRLDEWLERRRFQPGKVCFRSPIPALRYWLRTRGILALMIDQKPGPPSSTLKLWNRLEMPYNKDLMHWLRKKSALVVPVSTHAICETHVVTFHFPLDLDTMDERTLKSSLTVFLEGAIEKAPHQWNWSYPKLRAGD